MPATRVVTRGSLLAAGSLVVLALMLLVAAHPTSADAGVRLPAAGRLRVWTLPARARPGPHARVLKRLHEIRRDGRDQIVLAVGSRRGADGNRWYRLSLPMRPNGTTGWVPAASLRLAHVTKRIVIRRNARVLRLYRGRRLLFHTVVAIGAPRMPTPLGRFYVTAKFRPDDPFLGPWGLETSAYSRLTDWPGGGVVGIHGTSQPQLLGQAVSHGCVRVSNHAIRHLRRIVPLGTPIYIKR